MDQATSSCNLMTAYVTHQVHKLWPVTVFQQKLCWLNWNKSYVKSYEPFPTMQEKANYIKHQWSKNVKTHMVMQKYVYAYKSDTDDTVHFLCIFQIWKQSWWSQVEMMGMHHGQIQNPSYSESGNHQRPRVWRLKWGHQEVQELQSQQNPSDLWLRMEQRRMKSNVMKQTYWIYQMH